MWVIVSTGLGIVIALIELPSLLQQEKKRNLWSFTILLIVAIGLNIAQGLHMKLPNPLDWIAALYKPLSDWVFGWLKS